MSKTEYRFVQAPNGAVYGLTEINKKSKNLRQISDHEALKFFLSEGYDREKLKLFGLEELYDSLKSQSESKKKTQSSAQES